MQIILLIVTVLAGVALAGYIATAPNVPVWVKQLFNIMLGLIVFAGICFVIFVIMSIVAHI